MLAEAILIGRATKDTEMLELPSGKMKSVFGIACNPFKDETAFFDVTSYDAKATFCEKYVTKGRLVWCRCTIRPRTYEDKNGYKRHITDYILQEIKLLSSNQAANEEKPKKPTLTEYYEDESDVPF